MSEPLRDPLPQRIGDAERDRAAEYLRDHMAAGRLDQPEFDDRLTKALSARTADEIEPLFTDLPAPKPGTELTAPVPAAPPATAPPRKDGISQLAFVATVLAGLAWPAVIIVLAATGNWGSWWWLFLLPVFVSSWAGKLNGNDRRDHHGRDRDRDRRRELGD